MLKTILVLPDGTEISSGPDSICAVRNMTLTQCVSDGGEPEPGAACANMLQLELITPAGAMPIQAGQELTLYRMDPEGQRHKAGVFIASKPTRPGPNSLKLLAYDRVSLLDRDLTGWLGNLTGWPYPLQTFAAMVCDACGVALSPEPIPNGQLPVEKFSGADITGRRLIRWVAQACGSFCRANENGLLEFAWYTPKEGVRIGPRPVPGTAPRLWVEGEALSWVAPAMQTTWANRTMTCMDPGLAAAEAEGNLTLTALPEQIQYFYYRGSLSASDTAVAPVDGVCLRQSREDIGTLFPETGGENVYMITGNPLLTAKNRDSLLPTAEALYLQLKDTACTPCKLSMPATMTIRAGDIVPVVTPNGRVLTMYVMKKTQSGQRDTLECTGSATRAQSALARQNSLQALSGRVLELSMTVDGIRAQNRDDKGSAAELSMTVEGIAAQVSHQSAQLQSADTRLTRMEQNAQSLELQIQTIQTQGVSRVETTTGYTFGQEGLRIRKSGEEMENRLDNTGMYVTRAGQTVLAANNRGVEAADVSVRNYLVVGSHARLEDYHNGADPARTGCFFV